MGADAYAVSDNGKIDIDTIATTQHGAKIKFLKGLRVVPKHKLTSVHLDRLWKSFCDNAKIVRVRIEIIS